MLNWHYSKRMPVGKLVKIGVWEHGKFIGVLLFGYGACQNGHKFYDLPQTEVCELVRVALTTHESPVSRILTIAMKLLKRKCPGLRIVFSYADGDQGHHGGIYAANGWIYSGLTNDGKKQTPYYIIHGQERHGRSLASLGYKQNLAWLRENVDPHAEQVIPGPKHRYIYVFDPTLKPKFEKLRKPYPKRKI